MGIGSRYTWHGSPDARVHGEQGDVNVVFSHFLVENLFDEDNDEGSDLASNDGTSTDIECKNNVVLNSDMSQVVATCVVSSFTQKCRHNSLSISCSSFTDIQNGGGCCDL